MKTTLGTALVPDVLGDAAKAAGANTPTAIRAAMMAALKRLTTEGTLRVGTVGYSGAVPRHHTFRPLFVRYVSLAVPERTIGWLICVDGYHRDHAQPPRGRDESLPPAARQKPRRLVSLGSRRARSRDASRPADLPVDRLRGLSLVSRDGTRIVRERGDRALPEQPLRFGQGRPRGKARPRPGLHGGSPVDDWRGRLADVGVPDSDRAPVLRRALLSRRAAPRDAVVPPGARGRRPCLAGAALGGRGRRKSTGRGSRRAGAAGGRRRRSHACAARCRDCGDRRGIRCGEWRLGPRPEIPPADDDRIPAPAPRRDRGSGRAAHRAPFARCDGRRGAA